MKLSKSIVELEDIFILPHSGKRYVGKHQNGFSISINFVIQ